MALTIDGSDPTGDLGDLLDAKLDLAGGKILQIVRATDATDRTTTSTSFVDANISVTITPQKSDSTIIVMWLSRSRHPSTGFIRLSITDNSDNALSGAESMGIGSTTTFANSSTSGYVIGYSTPATTSATTYKGRFSVDTGTGTLLNASNTGQMYAIEVSA